MISPHLIYKLYKKNQTSLGVEAIDIVGDISMLR